MDRNDTVSSSYAAAMGYVARCASEAQVLGTSRFSKRLYFESDDDRGRMVSADVVQAVSKYAKDRFDSSGSEFLPFVYMAKHDRNERVKTVFGETWNENVGGSRAVSLYLEEIVGLASEHLGSSRWILKHAAALSVAGIVKAVAQTQGDLSESNGEKVWPWLKIAVSEKTWEGKEEVVEAFGTFVEKGRQFWEGRSEVQQEIGKVSA